MQRILGHKSEICVPGDADYCLVATDQNVWIAIHTFFPAFPIRRPGSIEPYAMTNRDMYWRRCKIQETLLIRQWHLSPLQSKHLGTSYSVLLIALSCPLVFSISLMVWNVFPFRGDFSLGKTRSHRGPNLGCRRAESPGCLLFHKKTARDVMQKQLHCCDEAANHQLLIAAAFWIIQIVSTEEHSSLMQNVMQIHCSTPQVAGKHKACGTNLALHLVLSILAPCFYPAAVPSSPLTVKE